MTTSESGVDFRHWYNFQLLLLSLNPLLLTSSFYFEYAAVDDDAISFVRTGEQEMEEEDEEVVNVEKNEEGDENENERRYEIENDKKANERGDVNTMKMRIRMRMKVLRNRMREVTKVAT